ncbi:MAG: hypothetical protein K9M98_04725 [Cephaloticoccus sp.]|nr:hypothetical protein [Cephaloticoccus sp.]MCF7759789.1 hypothetical protein [Cephaloticoccus sp.]
MRLPGLPLLFALLGVLPLTGAPLAQPEWNRVQVDPMKTSIYVGSVTLTTAPFKQAGDAFVSTYAARVFPWLFWNETGRISIKLSETDRAKLQRGERTEFTGEAFNHKNKPRKVTGYAEPRGSDTGKIKVRIGVDDLELIFNGVYHLSTHTIQADQLSAATDTESSP